MLQWYLTTLCNLYSDQPSFPIILEAVTVQFLAACIFLLVLCTALSVISSCVYSPLSLSVETTSAAHCPLCWLLSQKHGIEQ